MSEKILTIDQFVPNPVVVNFAQLIVNFAYKNAPNNVDTSLDSGVTGQIELPLAKFRIANLKTSVRTAQGTAVTADIGYTGSTAYFHDDLNLNSAALTASSAAEIEIDNTAGDKFLTIIPSANLTAAKIHISFDMRVIDK